ncbi:MAG TPA: hypothetical protein VFJ16_26535, partial [Longimicrobium sp.]|nr:hypothetical protein [Longimicrobium sp.]
GRDARSPFALPAPGGDAGPYPPEQVRRTARDAARRQRADSVRLSVPASVGATVAAGGWPNLRYQARTRPSEYLALIERRGPRDHQAWLFDELCTRLVDEGVLLRRYYHDGDPRVCWAEAGGRGVSLAELQREHPGHRLILLGDGAALADVRTGELHPWTRALAAWGDRALLTPEPMGGWGLREAVLADALPVFPATLDGVRGAVEFFADDTEPDWYGWWERNLGDGENGEGARPVPVATSKEALAEYLGPRGLRWLGALAVYPELHWRLTRMLGGLPGLGADADERGFLRLVRLRWLRRGVIPNADREWLIRELGEKREMAVRAEILKVLDAMKDAAPDAASGRLELDRLVQQLFLYRHDRRRTRKLMRKLRRMPRAQLMEDVAVVRLLEERAARSPLAVLLPRRFHRFLFHDGIPAFGTRFLARAVGYASAAVALWLVVPTSPAPGPIVTGVLGVEAHTGSTLGSLGLPAVTDTLGRAVAGAVWTSDPKDVVSIREGRLSVMETGRARLWASADSSQTGFDIRVVPDTVNLYVIRVADRVLTVGRGQLRPLMLPDRPRWVSCAPTVRVSPSGVVEAVAEGTAPVLAITATGIEVGMIDVARGAAPRNDTLKVLASPLFGGSPVNDVTYSTLTRLLLRGGYAASIRVTAVAGTRSRQVGTEVVGWLERQQSASEISVSVPDRLCEWVMDHVPGPRIRPTLYLEHSNPVVDSVSATPPRDSAASTARADSAPAVAPPIQQPRPSAPASAPQNRQPQRPPPSRATPQRPTPVDSVYQGGVWWYRPVTARASSVPSAAVDSVFDGGAWWYRQANARPSRGAGTDPAADSAGRRGRPSAALALRSGDIRFANGDYAGALQVYDSARVLDPAQARTALARQAMANSRRGRWKEAATALTQALAADSSLPDTPWLRLELCAALRLSGGRGDTRAAKACERAGSGNRDTADIQTALIVMLRDIPMASLGEGQPVRSVLNPGPPRVFRMISCLDPTSNALRVWEQGGTRWTETLPSGAQNFYDEVARVRLGEEEGTVVREVNAEFYVWVPDGANRGPDGPPLRYQRGGYMMNWAYLGPMVISMSGRN